MPSESYREFIKEAFIAPIRSVLIVDDDYPTFDEILFSQIEANKSDEPPVMNSEKDWYKDPVSIQGVLNKFREAGQPLLVDIHDGHNVEIGEEPKAASHLHQSDLLVLDYQLDRDRVGDGTKAIDIARALGRNSHFNMVLVHTSEILDDVFRQMLVGLMGPITGIISTEESAAVEKWLSDIEDENPDITAQLVALASREHYLHYRRISNVQSPSSIKAPSMNGFQEVYDKYALNADFSDLVFRWALHGRQTELAPEMNVEGSPELSWSEIHPRWLRTDFLFMAFTKKGKGDDLLGDLLDTLTAWNPRPSRLFLAALRNQLEEKGVLAESKALGSNHVLAHWYSRLLDSDGAQRDYMVGESVARHSEQLLRFVMPDVIDFASRLVSSETDNSVELCKNYFNVDLTKPDVLFRSQIEHNAFVCSKKVEGYHLTTGHVLCIDDEVYACLSPSCDLVPGKKKEARYGDIGDTLPFTAVRLQVVPGEKLPKRVQTNRFIFIELAGKIKIYSLNDPQNENAGPHWFTLYAEQEGRFDKANNSLKVQRIVSDGKGGLKSHSSTATVIAQLRYEYALNLLQKLGSVMGRVGLDFVGA